MPQSYMALTKADAKWLLRQIADGVLTDSRSVQIAGNLQEYLERFDRPRFNRENGIRRLAQKSFSSDGDLEFDDNAVVSEGDDNGAYVMAWKWLSFDGSRFNKDKS